MLWEGPWTIRALETTNLWFLDLLRDHFADLLSLLGLHRLYLVLQRLAFLRICLFLLFFSRNLLFFLLFRNFDNFKWFCNRLRLFRWRSRQVRGWRRLVIRRLALLFFLRFLLDLSVHNLRLRDLSFIRRICKKWQWSKGFEFFHTTDDALVLKLVRLIEGGSETVPLEGGLGNGQSNRHWQHLWNVKKGFFFEDLWSHELFDVCVSSKLITKIGRRGD